MNAVRSAIHAAIPLVALVSGLAQATPVKIGVLETLSGPQASSGLAYRAAVRYAVDKLNAAGGWNGQPVQLLEYDNQGGPAGASDKLKAAAAEGVQIIVQGASSAIGGQITEDVRKHNLRNPGKEIVYINVGAEALELTGEKCNFHHFRFSGNAQVRAKVLVQAMKQAQTLGTRVYSINQNYSWGHDMERAIVDNAGVGGYQVVEKTLHDTNKIQDFAPYVAKISASGADTVMTGNWSNDLLLLMKATKSAGLKVRFGTVFLDQVGNIANAGEQAVGHFVAQTFNPEAAGAEGERFFNDYKAKTGRSAVATEPQTVFGLEMVADALKRTKPEDGKLNVNALARALETTRLKTPMGEAVMRASDHQVLLPLVVSVVSKDAKYKVDDTDLGFKPVKIFTAEEAAAPVQASCKMQRPG
ncbi:MAG: branched-chain amino acid ABC transporter substrate-binding protein [Rubrivivax sp.]|nr:branched-chain amino acid ABC transporter substrate-binding protein [Rubrivivax sp.]